MYSDKFKAIAAVGLFMNPKAYGEAFHITAGSETTWGNIVETIGKKLNHRVNLVDIPIEFLQGKKNIGIDIAELSGDMLFLNLREKSPLIMELMQQYNIIKRIRMHER